MILYGSSLSPYVRKVLVALAEKGMAFEHRPVAPQADDPAFRAASPLGKIPAMDDDGFVVSESSAILHYLDGLAPSPALFPAGPKLRARAIFLEEFADVECTPKITVAFRERVLKPRFFKTEGDEALVRATLTEQLPKVFDYLETQIDGPYLVGGAFSAADISLASPFHNFRMAKAEVDATRWPKLARWVAETLERPSFVQAIAAPIA